MMVLDTPEQQAIMDRMKGLEYNSEAHIALLKEYWELTKKIYKGTFYEGMIDPPNEEAYEIMRETYANEKQHYIIK